MIVLTPLFSRLHPERRMILLLSSALALALFAISVSSPALPQKTSLNHSFVIVDVTIVNVNAPRGNSALKAHMTIEVERDRITAIRPTSDSDIRDLSVADRVPLPEGLSSRQTIDGRGLYAIPGLIDMNVHLQWKGDEDSMLKILLAHGVTAILENGSSSESVYRWSRSSLSPDFVGPRMEVCGPDLTFPPADHPGMTIVQTARQVRQALSIRAAAGARFAKFSAQLPPSLTLDVTQLAQRRGMRVVGHLGRTNALEATAFGVNVISTFSGIADSALPDPNIPRGQHTMGLWQGWQATNRAWPLADDRRLGELIRHMIANRVAFAPALFYQEILGSLGKSSSLKDEAITNSYAPPSLLSDWQRPPLDLGDPKIYALALPLQKKFLKQFSDSGGLLVTGSNTPGPYVAPGFGLHQEMETLVQAGLSPLEALKAATVNASRALGHEEEYGSIEIGNRADFALIEADPLVNIRNTRKIRSVFRSGNIYSPRQLLSGLPR